LSLIRLSEQVRLNPSYLSRLYRQTTGVTLSDFIDHERIALAKELPSGAYVHVQDVAQQTGYESAMSFTRFFKKNTGHSPQEYRQGQS
jgi:two-component system response regulator YesN